MEKIKNILEAKDVKDDLVFKNRINVTKPVLPDFDSYCEKIKKVWENHWLTNNGPLHENLKDQLEKYLHVSHVELFSNGHLALEVALKALDIKGEVITTPFTFASTTHAITNCGLEPVFCDIEPNTFNIDVDKIEALITERTSAILAVHVFGMPCDVYAIESIAKKYNLKVIYDAAHAFGVKINGESIANFGDISMFSFHATKVFHTIEGGMLAFNDIKLSDKIKALRNFGLTSGDHVEYVGTNAKMNEFQAAMGICNLESIEDYLENRKYVYKEYVKGLTGIKHVRFLPELKNVKHNYSYFPILLGSHEIRDNLFEKMKKYNVYTRKYFYPLCNDFDCYHYTSETTPIAKSISDSILALPMYPDLNSEEINQICEIIKYELGE
jgi:dTDP-4-amino-4,6-dideoxygalactose transaminase